MNFEFAIIKSDNCTYLCRKDEETYYCVDNPMLYFTEGEDEFEIISPDESYRKKIYKYKGRKVRVEAAIYDNGWLAIHVVNPEIQTTMNRLLLTLVIRMPLDYRPVHL